LGAWPAAVWWRRRRRRERRRRRGGGKVMVLLGWRGVRMGAGGRDEDGGEGALRRRGPFAGRSIEEDYEQGIVKLCAK